MRLRWSLFLVAAVIGFAAPQAATQSGDKPAESAAPAKSGPPPAPTVTRSPTGIIVVTGSGSRPAETKPAESKPAETKDAAQDKKPGAPAKSAGGATKAEGAAKSPSGGSAPAKSAPGTQPAAGQPQSTSSQRQVLAPDGSPIAVQTRQTSQTSKTGSQSSLLVRNINGYEVPYLQEEEQIVSQGPGGEVVERRAHRYNSNGTPTSQQLVREEKKTLPDGTVETTTLVYESDANGRMQAVERKVEQTKKVGDTTRTVTTSEMPDVNGGFRTQSRAEAVETRQGETSATVEKTVRVADGSGRLVEAERERSVMTKTGEVATTETTVWKQSASNAGGIELYNRSVGKLTQKADGSMTETVETYGRSRNGGPVDVNASTAQLQERIVRETQVTSSGETIQTTTTQSRGVADASQLGQKQVMRKVARPTANGETIETQVFEQGVNGGMRPTESYVEQVNKQAP